MGWIIDLFTTVFSITGNWFIDAIIFAIIGFIAFYIAFVLVGKIYDAVGFHDSKLMSISHWLIRIALFIFIAIILRLSFEIIQCLVSIKWYVYLIVAIAIFFVASLIYIIKRICSKKTKERKAQSKKKKENTIKKYYVYKYWPVCILICSVGVSVFLCLKHFNYCILKNLMVTDIIITLMPLIFTIITLSLSLPSETIYGQPLSLIRKIRKDRHFEFIEMIVINIVIFFLLTLFEIFKLTIQVWALDIISLIYCILFCFQEVPILAKNSKYVKKIIKKSGYLDELSKNTDLFDGNTSDGKKVEDILQAILLTDGIVSTYNSFKTKNESNNIILLDNLLSLQNSYLFKCDENKGYLSSMSSLFYKGIDILKAIEMSFSNIDSCISSKQDFNYIEIVKNTKTYYLITRSIFGLHSLMKEFNLEEKFNDNLKKVLHTAFIKIGWGNPSIEEKAFIYRILNNMIAYTISNNEMWFAESVRDVDFDTKYFSYGIDYFYFLTMYLFFISKIERKVTDDIKNSINELLKSNCNGLNSEDGDSIISIFNYNWYRKSFNDLANILPNLLQIYEACDEYYNWFQPPRIRSWSSNDGLFDKSFIIKNWLVLIISSYSYWNLDFKIIKKIFEELDSNDKKILVDTIDNNFIENGKFIIRENDFEYANFYNARIYINHQNYSQDFFREIVKYVKKYDKMETLEKIKKNAKSGEDCQRYKDILISKLISEVENFEIYSSSLEVNQSKKYCYKLLLMSEWVDESIDSITNDYKHAFDELLFEEVKRHVSCTKEINQKNANGIIDSILQEEYDYRNNSCYILYDFINQNKIIEAINKIEEKNLWLPNACFWKKNALKFNLVCDEEATIVRPLNRDEINKMIDEEFSQVDGLYKYNRYQNDNKSIFISREELIDIISKGYIFICVVFSYKIEVDEKLIVSIYKNDEKD